MDDVAKVLSMSKKTLYQCFKDKDELVDQATQAHLEREEHEFTAIYEQASNSIEELFLVSRCLRRSLAEVNPNLLLDLKKFYPKSWNRWVNFKEKFIYKSISANLERGVSDGFFRKSIKPEILASLRVWEIELMFTPGVFSRKFDFRDVQMQMFDHFVFGLLTRRGRKLYEEYETQETTFASR